MPDSNYFNQNEYDLRCEWGLEGVNRLSAGSDVLVIVDVISFSTSVDIAVSRGARVYPFRWRDERLEAFAQKMNAVPAIASRKDPAGLSLAPSSMLRAAPGAALVLPSPNGATLSLAVKDVPILAGCLRNARAVATAASRLGRRVSVIPAGERWPDGSLRPALEDQLGAGAILHYLPGSRSPEAQAAEAIFLHFQHNLLAVLSVASSGKEAAEHGSPLDLDLAAALNASDTAPRLVDEAFSR